MHSRKSTLRETTLSDSSLWSPSFEALEERVLLSGNPTFVTPLSQGYWVPVPGSSGYNTRVIGVDGSSDTTSITAVVDGSPSGLTVSVANGVTTDYADLHFVTSGGTAIGDIVFQLFDNTDVSTEGSTSGQVMWSDSVAAAQRFADLATEGVVGGALDASATPFYTNVVVHRVIPGFMIQTGDATKGDGTGGSGLGNLTDSFDPNLSFVGAGVVALANTGSANSSDCQFFITDAPTTWLNGGYMIIGQVVSGWNVLNQIIAVPTDASNNRPLDPPIMQSVTIFQTVSDATVTLQTDGTFTGPADVTITLNGTGGTTQQTIEVIPQAQMASEITSTPIASPKIAPGATGTVQAQFTPDSDISGLTMTYSANTSQSGATVSIESATQEVTITAPSSFSGLFPVTLTATATGEGGFWADPLPESVSFDVVTQGPGDPVLESNTVAAGGGEAYKTVPYGNYLLEAAGTSGVVVYNVSNPDSPTEVGSFALSGSAQDIVIVGQTAFVADGSGGVAALNIADPTNIQLDGTVATTAPALGLAVDQTTNIAYVADGDSGVAEVSVSNPASMAVLRYIQHLTSSFSLTTIEDVVLKGAYAFASDTAGGVAVLNIANPASVTLTTAFGTYHAPQGLCLVGNTLYVADTYLIAYNMTNPAHPVMMDYLQMASAAQVSVVNGMALVGGGSSFSIVDVTSSTKMVLQYTFTGTGFVGASSAVGNNLAVAGGPDGLLMFQDVRTLLNQSATFVDANNVPVTVTIANGSANILTTGVNAGNILSVTFTTSSPTTTLTITTPAGKYTTVGKITDAVGSLKSLVAASTDITGGISVLGTLTTLTAYNVAGSAQQTIDISKDSSVPLAANASLAISLHNVTDVWLASLVPVSTLTVNSWTDTGSDDYIHAPSIGTLTVNGNLEAAIALSNASSVAKTLGTARVTGSITGYEWAIAGNVGGVTVGNVSNWEMTGYDNGLGTAKPLGSITSLTAGAVAATTINSTGYLGAIRAQSWTGGSITATGTAGVTTTGGELDADMTLSGAGVASTAKTLGLVSSAGAIDGTWNVTGATGTLTASSIPATWDGTFTGNILSLTVSHNALGQIQAGSINTVSVRGNYGDGVDGDTTLNLTMPLSGTKTAMTSMIVSGAMNDAELTSLANLGTLTVTGAVTGTTINSTGYLGAIRAQSWAGGSITASGTAGVTTTGGELDTNMTLSGIGVASTAKTLGLVSSAAGAIDGTWSVTGATGTLTASSIPATFSGTFSGNILSLTVSHNAYGQLRAGSITTMSVTGNYGDGVGGDTTLKLTQAFGGAKAALGALSVGGWMNDVNIVSTDSLGAITAGGMIGSNIYAGALSVDEVLPPILAINDTMVTPASIASVTVRGITGAAASFVNTNLVSWNIGTLKLNKIQVGNGGTPFGVAANSIKSYSAQIGAKLYTWMPTVSAWPDDTSASNGDYEVFKAI